MVTRFISPTKGPLTFGEMFAEMIAFMEAVPQNNYRIIVGTDSQERVQTVFVTAIVVHRVGKGARYFYAKQTHRKLASLRQRIFYEASRSLTIAGRLADQFALDHYLIPGVEIHLDVGTGGATKDLIREIVGMVTGSGFDAKIKPDAFAASTVADKYTKK